MSTLPFNILTSFFGAPGIVRLRTQLETSGPMQVSPATVYNILRAYYENNGLYDEINETLRTHGVWRQPSKPLRNPTYRVVEYYVDHVWPGELPEALPIIVEANANELIAEPIHQIWQWSNWATIKQRAVRQAGQYGDLFIKVAQTENRDRVYFQIIEPQYVLDFDEDSRGFLTWIRIDVMTEKRAEDGTVTVSTQTEVWDKERVRIWKHDKGLGRQLSELGTPTITPMADMGIDFIPIVHIKFKDVGDKRGAAAVLLEFDKIDEANNQATRLHQMLFRHGKPLYKVTANANDDMGRPLPAPTLSEDPSADGSGDFASVVNIGDEEVLYLPGMSDLDALVPQIDYSAALKILESMMNEIEKDLPELSYYRLQEVTNLSGVAIELMLSAAISKALEVRGNLESALIRADQMGLSVGIAAGLFPSTLGSYAAGSFNHHFAKRRVINLGDKEIAEILKAYEDAGYPVDEAMRRLGFTDEEINRVMAGRKRDAAASNTGLGTALANAVRQMNTQGGEGFTPTRARVAAGNNGSNSNGNNGNAQEETAAITATPRGV